MTKKWQKFPDILGDELLDRKRCHIMSVFSLTNASMQYYINAVSVLMYQLYQCILYDIIWRVSFGVCSLYCAVRWGLH